MTLVVRNVWKAIDERVVIQVKDDEDEQSEFKEYVVNDIYGDIWWLLHDCWKVQYQLEDYRIDWNFTRYPKTPQNPLWGNPFNAFIRSKGNVVQRALDLYPVMRGEHPRPYAMIVVSQDHIDNGIARNCNECPLALAAADAGFHKPCVMSGKLMAGSRHFRASYKPRSKKWWYDFVLDFDTDNGVEPQGFPVDFEAVTIPLPYLGPRKK